MRGPATPLLPALAVSAAALLATACQQPDTWARAYEIADLSDTIGGPKALARPGDFVIENDRIRVAILGPRPSMGPHTSGASVIDADLQRPDPRYLHGNGNDQLAEMFPTVNLNVQEADEYAGTVQVIADGSDGGPAVICTEGPEQSFISLLDPLWAMLWTAQRPIFRMRTDYILEPGSPALQMRTYAVFADESPCDADLDADPVPGSDTELDVLGLALETGLVMGDFYLQGGSIDVFLPGVGYDEKSYLHDLELEGINTMQDPIAMPFLAGVGDGVSYGLMADQGQLFFPLFTSSQTVAVGGGLAGDDTKQRRFADGTALSYDRWFTVGRGDVGSVLDNLLEVRGVPVGRVEGRVVEEGTGVALSGVHVFVYEPGAEAPYSDWITDVGDDPVPDGSFGGTLPVGDWELMVHEEGRPDGERFPITVEEGQTLELSLGSPQPASVHFTVVDETGLPVPAKVSFFSVDGDSPRDSVLGDGYIAGDPAQVSFVAHGEGQVVLPPGTYRAVASRGIEYEIDESDTFTLDRRETVDLRLQVVRDVDTRGWISADFHVHARPSHDSGVSLHDRALTMAAEGVEFFTSNDHDVITDYRPAIEDLGLEEWVNTAIGLEVTTIELGHFLGFPLVQDVMGDAGGALDWTGLTPTEIIDGIRGLGARGGVEPFVFVGHPRDGILGYFDQYHLNPYTTDANGQPVLDYSLLTASNPLLDADNFTLDFDGLELLNGKRFDFIRTPTQPELDAYAADLADGVEPSVSGYDIITRTMQEQQDLADGVYTLGYGRNGAIDDWFALLNMGYRFTALGNSDTHDKHFIEAGCPRNYVMADTDDPAFLDEAAVAEAVRQGRVIATYGPFVRFYAGSEDVGPGSTVQGSPVTLSIEVQSPLWMGVDRVELYENGTLIREWTDSDLQADDVLKFLQDVEVQPERDSWYVVIVAGDDDMTPIFTAVDIPPIQLQDVVMGALSGVGSIGSLLGDPVRYPNSFPVYPYAITNPIWVDADGDGEFTPPGLPDWLVEPTEPDAGKDADQG